MQSRIRPFSHHPRHRCSHRPRRGDAWMQSRIRSFRRTDPPNRTPHRLRRDEPYASRNAAIGVVRKTSRPLSTPMSTVSSTIAAAMSRAGPVAGVNGR